LKFSIQGDQNGYNIPEITPAPNVSHWLTGDGVKFINNWKEEKVLPEQVKKEKKIFFL